MTGRGCASHLFGAGGSTVRAMSTPVDPVVPAVPVVVAAGELLPANIITTAKAVAALVVNVVTVLTSTAVLALVPEDKRAWVLAVAAAILVVANFIVVYQVQPKVTTAITVHRP